MASARAVGLRVGEGAGGEAVEQPCGGDDGGEDAKGLHDDEGALGALDGETAAAALGAEEDGGGGRGGVLGGKGGGVGAEGLAEVAVGEVCGNPDLRSETFGKLRADSGAPGSVDVWLGFIGMLSRGLGIVWLCCGRGRGGCGR